MLRLEKLAIRPATASSSQHLAILTALPFAEVNKLADEINTRLSYADPERATEHSKEKAR